MDGGTFRTRAGHPLPMLVAALAYLGTVAGAFWLERGDGNPDSLLFLVPSLVAGYVIGSPWALALPVLGVAAISVLGQSPLSGAGDGAEIAALLGIGAGVVLRVIQAGTPVRRLARRNRHRRTHGRHRRP